MNVALRSRIQTPVAVASRAFKTTSQTHSPAAATQLLCEMADAPFPRSPVAVTGVDVAAERAQRQRASQQPHRDNLLRTNLSPNLQAFLRTTKVPNSNAARDFYLRGMSSSTLNLQSQQHEATELLSQTQQESKEFCRSLIEMTDMPWVTQKSS